MRRLVVVALLCPAALAAQVSLTTAGGVSRLDGFGSGGITSLGGDLRGAFGPVRLAAAGNTTDRGTFGRSTWFRGDLAVSGARGAWRGDIGPLLRAGDEISARSTTLYGGAATLARRIGPATLSARVEEGVAHLEGQRARWGQREVRGDVTLGPFDLGFSWQRLMTRDSVLRDDVFFDPAASSLDTLFQRRVRTVQDVALRAAWGHRGLAVDVEGGRRTGETIKAETWWRAGASLRVTPLVALVATIDRRPSDLMLGLRGGRTTMVGLRFSPPQRGETTRAALRAVETRREGARRVRVILTLPALDRAQLMGDATEWAPIALTRRHDGRWEATLDAAPGLYRFNVSLDGGPWTVPAGIPAVADDFGGKGFLLAL